MGCFPRPRGGHKAHRFIYVAPPGDVLAGRFSLRSVTRKEGGTGDLVSPAPKVPSARKGARPGRSQLVTVAVVEVDAKAHSP